MGEISRRSPAGEAGALETKAETEISLPKPKDWLKNVRVSGVVIDELGRRWEVTKMSDSKSEFGKGKFFSLIHIIRDRGQNVVGQLEIVVTALLKNQDLIKSDFKYIGGEEQDDSVNPAPDFSEALFVRGWMQQK